MDLVALEEIRQVKYRYLRCVDLKLWDEMEDVFTAEASAEYGTHAAGRELNLYGRDEIVGYLRDNLRPAIITVHRCGQPEINDRRRQGDRERGRSRTPSSPWSTASDQGGRVLRGHLRARRGRQVADLAHRLQADLRDHESLDDSPSLRFIDNMWAPKKAG